MTDVPASILAAATAAIRDQFRADLDKPGAPEPDALARAALEAAAPLLAEAVAQKILEHAERQHPRDPDHIPTAWDRHFGIAARVAASVVHWESFRSPHVPHGRASSRPGKTGSGIIELGFPSR